MCMYVRTTACIKTTIKSLRWFQSGAAAAPALKSRQREKFVILGHVRGHQRRDIMKFSKFRILQPTLSIPNCVSNEFSVTTRPNQNHQHISFNKLTDGYRKRLSTFRAISQNVTKMPQNSVHHFFLSKPRRLQFYLNGGYLNRLYKSYTIRYNNNGAARHWNSRQRGIFVILRHVRGHQRQYFMNFSKFQISQLTLNYQTLMSTNFSGTPRPNQKHQHITLNKPTGGFRKRLRGSKARSQNATKMSQNSVHQIFASRPRRL